MKSLKEIILQKSPQKNRKIDVGHYLNRMLDPQVIDKVAEFFADSIPKREGITKVLTVESAGIALAYATAQKLSAKALFAHRNRTKAEKKAYFAEVAGARAVSVSLPKEFLTRDDKVLIVDDFIGVGNATNALIELVRQSGAQLSGVCVVIERKYLGGSEKLRSRGIPLTSCVTILSEEPNNVIFE